MELVTNRHLSHIFCMKCRYVGGKYMHFMTANTKPLTFSYATEPMDADDWLQSIEKMLQVVQYNNREKVLLSSHQLSSPTAD
jgi:hypothetical protein